MNFSQKINKNEWHGDDAAVTDAIDERANDTQPVDDFTNEDLTDEGEGHTEDTTEDAPHSNTESAKPLHNYQTKSSCGITSILLKPTSHRTESYS